jgi:predicted glycosyltransferase
MIWIDIATPKYAHFFARLIPYLNNILITARYSPNYKEVKEILDSYNLNYH